MKATSTDFQFPVYLFPLVKNLIGVIQKKEKSDWYDRPFNNLVDFWKERWSVPRSERLNKWQEFTADSFFKKIQRQLKEL